MKKFNEYDIFDKALILMGVGDKTTQDAVQKTYNDFNKKGILTFEQWREKMNELWAANFAKVIEYEIKSFISNVLYHEDVPEKCEELPIRISIGNRYLEIPMDPITQGALEVALEHFSVAVNDNYEQ